MKKLKMLATILIAMILITSCQDRGNNGLFNCIKGEGDIVSQTLNIGEFHSLRLRGSSDVFITQSNDFQVIVEGQQNIIDNIELDIQNGRWEIEFEDCMRNHDKLKFYITMPKITRLEVSGSGDIFGQNDFLVDTLDLKVDGSGSIDVALTDTEDLYTRIAGSGKIKLQGAAYYNEVKITGSGDLKAFDLQSNIAEVKITGSGDAELNVSDELDVKITGSGDVYYKGNPLINVDITGTGDLKNSN